MQSQQQSDARPDIELDRTSIAIRVREMDEKVHIRFRFIFEESVKRDVFTRFSCIDLFFTGVFCHFLLVDVLQNALGDVSKGVTNLVKWFESFATFGINKLQPSLNTCHIQCLDDEV